MTVSDRYMKRKLYERQGGKCNAPCDPDFQGVSLELRLLELDHIDSNGPDDIENRQLLCSHCNRVKREQSMEYLMNYHKKRWERMQLPLFNSGRIAKRRQPIETRKQQSQPQYMSLPPPLPPLVLKPF